MARDSKRRDDDDIDEDRPRSRRRSNDDDDRPRRSSNKKAKSNPWIIWGPVIGVVVVGLAVGIYFITKPKKSSTTTSPEVAQQGDYKENPSPFAPKKNPPVDNPIKGIFPGNDAHLVQANAVHFRADCAPNKIERIWVNDRGTIAGVAWASFDGGKKNNIVDRFDVKTGNKLGRAELGSLDQMQHMALSPDGNLVLHYENALDDGFKKKVSVYDLAQNKPVVQRVQPYPKGDLTASMYWADFITSDRIVTVSSKREVKVFSLPEFKEESSLKVAGTTFSMGHQDPYTKEYKDVALSADRTKLAIWNGDGFTFVNTMDCKETGKSQGLPEIISPSTEVMGTAFSPNGRQLVSIISSFPKSKGNQRQITLVRWDVDSLQRSGNLQPVHEKVFTGGVLKFWGSKHVLLFNGGIGQALLASVDSAQPVCEVIRPYHGRVAFSRDGSLWYAGGENDQGTAFISRVELPETYAADANVWSANSLRRLWLGGEGAKSSPDGVDSRLNLALIPKPTGN
jgi:hypothetical protein